MLKLPTKKGGPDINAFYLDMESKYLVLESLNKKGEREISVVPDIWLQGNMCYWPNSKQTKHSRKKTIPKKTWSSFQYKILKDNIGIFN